MELTQQVATLDDELKLLKGEIKVILKEIRAAVLSNNNPFTMDTSAVDAPAPAAPAPSVPDETAATEEEAPPEPAMPELPLAGPVGPTTPPLDGPLAGPTGPPVGPGGPPPAAQEEMNASKGQRWSLLTIAGLMAWAEDAVATVGSDRFRAILELATLAELLPEDMRDVLDRLAKLAPVGGRDKDKPIDVIECVVVLHQLEAILQGETPTRLPLRRDTAWLGPMQATG